MTAAGSQSVDGKSAYVQIFLNGSQGTSASHESVAAVRDIVASVTSAAGYQGPCRRQHGRSTPTPRWPGIKA